MNNEEIKALLRELSESADAAGRSRTVKITFDRKLPPEPDAQEGAPEEETTPEPEETTPEPEETTPEPEDLQKKPELEPLPSYEPETDADAAFDAEKEEERSRRPRRRPRLQQAEQNERKRKAGVEPPRFEDDADAFFEEEEEDDALSILTVWKARLAAKRQESAAKREPESREKKPSNKKGQAEDLNARTHVPLLQKLSARGIRVRELLLILAGLILVLVLVILALNLLRNRAKSENVSADEGLRVTVEQEPENWTNEAEVTLGIRTSSPMQSISVNGENCLFSGKTKTEVTVLADSALLEIMVVTEETILNATAQIPMIDAEDPVITVSVENGMASLDAVDGQSGVEGVWYGTQDGFSEIPVYEKYTGSFRVEPDTVYSYYAKDAAGNQTAPVSTSLTPAQSITISRSAMTLFPNETGRLEVKSVPEGAFVNGFKLTSKDPHVATVDADGVVTAISNGQAVIEASADNLPSVSCTVTVQSQAEVTISAVGDVTLGDDVNFSQQNSFGTVYSMYGASWFFENVRSIFERDDITFVNLEGTLTDQGERESKQFAFRGLPEYTKILQDGSVEVVTLANNHSRDYGDVSLTDTEHFLTEAGIDYCLGDRIVLREQGGLKIAFIGIYVLDEGAARESQVRSTISKAQEEGADLIVMAFHWGTESSYTPDSVQKSLAHIAVDCGADLVMGHHPHVLQGIEEYNGKYIVYSLGNFCFGGNSNPSDKDTMIFQQTFRVEAGGQITGSSIRIIPCSVSSVSTWNNYQPTPAVGEEGTRIKEKIQQMSSELGCELEDNVFSVS